MMVLQNKGVLLVSTGSMKRSGSNPTTSTRGIEGGEEADILDLKHAVGPVLKLRLSM